MIEDKLEQEALAWLAEVGSEREDAAVELELQRACALIEAWA
jgi:hypothetical protein